MNGVIYSLVLALLAFPDTHCLIRTEFRSHEKIEPQFYHARAKRQVRSTLESNLQHIQDLNVHFTSRGQNFTLDLQLNQNLIPKGYFQKYQKKGKDVIEKPGPGQIELCHYQGRIRGVSDSWAAVSTCNGVLSGALFDGRQMHFLEHDANAQYHFREEDMVANHTSRTKRDLKYTERQEDNEIDDSRPNKKFRIKGPWNANSRSRYVELLLVVDKKEYVDHGKDLNKIYRICKDMANVMNALYMPLNIYVSLVGVVVWTQVNRIEMSTDGDVMLTKFLNYRRSILLKDHPNDNAQLLTGIQFDGGVVGKALKGPMCTYEFSGGVNMWHSDKVGLLATTVAHEMGHNFGMEHDSEDCECPDEKCIMAPASSKMKPTFWSSCSLEYLALAFEHGMDYCLRNKPTQLFDGPVCGNGFVEFGEECDCGLKDNCDNPCCDPTTCKLHLNATCATGECCDLTTCELKEPGVRCRRATHECDLPEFCTGYSEFCPDDVHKVDGTSCKAGQSFCYGGTCRTHSDQCKLLWGPTGKKSDDQCYDQNRKGTRHGNCGYHRPTDAFLKCQDEDVRCGMLHCTHLNEQLEFGMESVATLSHSFINSDGKIIPCRTALVDLGINDVDPGLAPEGAKCGHGKLCVSQKCLPVASLAIGPNACPDDCNGRGVCNSKGHCHCDAGYAPPHCSQAGAGGSVDSGPASHPGYVWPAVLGVSLVLVPLLLICVILAFRKRQVLLDKASFLQRPLDEQRSAYEPKPIPDLVPASGTSSPTHALLPHVETSSSALSTVVTERNECGKRSEGSLFGSLASGIEKSRSKFRSKSVTSQDGVKKRTLMDSIAKSITFPSPKFRGAIKPPSNVKYEIKVEHQEPKLPETPIASPEEIEVKEIVKEDVAKVDTTVSVLPMSNSSSLTTFAASRRLPYRTTLPVSKSLKTFDEKPTSVVENPMQNDDKRQPTTVAAGAATALSHSSSSGAVTAFLSKEGFVKGSQSETLIINKGQHDRPSLPEKPLSLIKDDNIMPLTKTTTLPSSLSKGGPSPLPKSSTLPLVPHARPQISKPILQTATPSAASLIERAPSTGVSQSSILSGTKTKDRASRGVVFCDPLTLPSPTNPNNPPIIHQNATTSSTPTSTVSPTTTSGPLARGTVVLPPPTTTVAAPPPATAPPSATFTPKWSTEPKALFSDAVICHIDEEAKPDKPGPPKPVKPVEKEPSASVSDKVESPTEDKSKASKIKSKFGAKTKGKDDPTTSSPTASLKSFEGPPKPPERGTLRTLQISNPILQSAVDIKTDLVPVCRSGSVPDAVTVTPSPRPSPLPATKASSPEKPSPTKSKKGKAPLPPPVAATKPKMDPIPPRPSKAKRPASIATTRPVRPTAPPPRPPPTREGAGSPSKSSDTSSIASTSSKASEPVYDSIREETEKSPLEDFITPTQSPVLSRRASDTMSTGSSTDGGDLMREILKEMKPRDPQEESIYSTLVRKDKKKRKHKKSASVEH